MFRCLSQTAVKHFFQFPHSTLPPVVTTEFSLEAATIAVANYSTTKIIVTTIGMIVPAVAMVTKQDAVATIGVASWLVSLAVVKKIRRVTGAVATVKEGVVVSMVTLINSGAIAMMIKGGDCGMQAAVKDDGV